jgi:serine/threonine protein kinase
MKILGPLGPDLKDLMDRNKDFKGINFPELKKLQTIEGRYKNKISGKALNFLKGTLTMSPHNRLTAEECLCHAYFEDLRLKDPDLQDLNKAFDHNRIESTKATDGGTAGGGMEERRNSSSKNNQVKIRIKTITENPLQESKRKSGVQSMEDGKQSPIGFSEDQMGMTSKKSPKTYYNIYEKNNQFEDSKYYKQNLWRVIFAESKNRRGRIIQFTRSWRSIARPSK